MGNKLNKISNDIESNTIKKEFVINNPKKYCIKDKLNNHKYKYNKFNAKKIKDYNHNNTYKTLTNKNLNKIIIKNSYMTNLSDNYYKKNRILKKSLTKNYIYSKSLNINKNFNSFRNIYNIDKLTTIKRYLTFESNNTVKKKSVNLSLINNSISNIDKFINKNINCNKENNNKSINIEKIKYMLDNKSNFITNCTNMNFNKYLSAKIKTENKKISLLNNLKKPRNLIQNNNKQQIIDPNRINLLKDITSNFLETNNMQLLSPSSQDINDYYLLSENLVKLSYFKELANEKKVIDFIVSKMEYCYIEKDKVLIEEGSNSLFLIFLKKGSINEYYSINNENINISKDNRCINYINNVNISNNIDEFNDKSFNSIIKKNYRGPCFIDDISIISNTIRTNRYITKDNCFLYKLEKHIFLEIIKEYNCKIYQEEKTLYFKTNNIAKHIVTGELALKAIKLEYSYSELLFSKDDLSLGIYFISDGEVEVKRSPIKSKIKSNDIIGIMYFFGSKFRTCDISVSSSNAVIYYISFVDLANYFGEDNYIRIMQNILILSKIECCPHFYLISKVLNNDILDHFELNIYKEKEIILKKNELINKELNIIIQGDVTNINKISMLAYSGNILMAKDVFDNNAKKTNYDLIAKVNNTIIAKIPRKRILYMLNCDFEAASLKALKQHYFRNLKLSIYNNNLLINKIELFSFLDDNMISKLSDNCFFEYIKTDYCIENKKNIIFKNYEINESGEFESIDWQFYNLYFIVKGKVIIQPLEIIESEYKKNKKFFNKIKSEKQIDSDKSNKLKKNSTYCFNVKQDILNAESTNKLRSKSIFQTTKSIDKSVGEIELGENQIFGYEWLFFNKFYNTIYNDKFEKDMMPKKYLFYNVLPLSEELILLKISAVSWMKIFPIKSLANFHIINKLVFSSFNLNSDKDVYIYKDESYKIKNKNDLNNSNNDKLLIKDNKKVNYSTIVKFIKKKCSTINKNSSHKSISQIKSNKKFINFKSEKFKNALSKTFNIDSQKFHQNLIDLKIDSLSNFDNAFIYSSYLNLPFKICIRAYFSKSIKNNNFIFNDMNYLSMFNISKNFELGNKSYNDAKNNSLINNSIDQNENNQIYYSNNNQNKNDRKNFSNNNNLNTNYNNPFIPKVLFEIKSNFLNFSVMFPYYGKDLYYILYEKKYNPQIDIIKFWAACLLIIIKNLHYANILHRNIKPENILLLDNYGYLAIEKFEVSTILYNYFKFKTNSIKGTPHYMAPEVILNSNGYSFSVDYWAYGVCLYEFTFKKHPFGSKSNNPKEIYSAIINE